MKTRTKAFLKLEIFTNQIMNTRWWCSRSFLSFSHACGVTLELSWPRPNPNPSPNSSLNLVGPYYRSARLTLTLTPNAAGRYHRNAQDDATHRAGWFNPNPYSLIWLEPYGRACGIRVRVMVGGSIKTSRFPTNIAWRTVLPLDIFAGRTE